MKQISSFLLVLAMATPVLAGIGRFEVPHEKVTGFCKLKLSRHDGSSWAESINKEFSFSTKPTNFTKVPVVVEGRDLELNFVYNLKGTTWMSSDPKATENVYFILKEKGQAGYLADANFSAINDQFLPTQFYLRDSFDLDDAKYISVVECRTRKFLRGKRGF